MQTSGLLTRSASGFSRVLEGVFSGRLADDENLQAWMTNWLQSLANPRPGRTTSSRWPRGPYDTPENRRRYPNLVQALTPARGASHRSVTDIYAALEWALFYTCEAHNPDIAIRQLSAEAGPNYSQRLSRGSQLDRLRGPAARVPSHPQGQVR